MPLVYAILIKYNSKTEKSMQSEFNPSLLPGVMALAYLGDARHALFVRRMLLEKNVRKPKELNLLALDYVTAEAQARAYERIAELLTECESDVFKRAYNSTHLNKPKHASGKEYRIATGFEAVIGMLEWMGNEERINELLTAAYKEKENDTEN